MHENALFGYIFEIIVTPSEGQTGVNLKMGKPKRRWRFRSGQVVVAEETDRVINSTSTSFTPAGYRFPRGGNRGRDALVPALRRVLPRVGELVAERGITVDHVTIYRWEQTFTAAFIDTARPARRATSSDTLLAGRCTHVRGCVELADYAEREAIEADRLKDVVVVAASGSHGEMNDVRA